MFFMGRILFFMERAGGLSGNPGSGSRRRTVRTSQLASPATSGKAGMMEGKKNLMPEKKHPRSKADLKSGRDADAARPAAGKEDKAFMGIYFPMR